jgi:prepilin-type processing-associated H-X9-DG protein/prepilin-type N-terminal cleavage/methylation domain-containing protein
MRRPRIGFTLIELLVVLAVIAVLAAILFPVFARAREKARTAMCSSNLRQLSMAIHEYMQDWEGGLPEFYQPGRTPEEFVSFRWYGHLSPYLRNTAILHCPADTVTNGLRAVYPPDPRSRQWANLPIFPHLSYAYNFWIQQTQETTVSLPSDTLLVADGAAHQCADAVRILNNVATSCFADANGTEIVDVLSPLTGSAGQERHGGGSNVAFFDGHVRFIPAGQFRKRRQPDGACFEYPLVETDCQVWQ